MRANFLKFSFLFIAVFFLNLSVRAQESIRVSALQDVAWLELENSFTFYSSDKNLSPQEFLKTFNNLEKPTANKSDKAVWYYVIIENDLPDSQRVYLNFDRNIERINAYTLSANTITDSMRSGFLLPYNLRNIPISSHNLTIDIAPKESLPVLVKAYNITNVPVGLNVFNVAGERFSRYIFRVNRAFLPQLGIAIGFQGAMFIMVLYMLLLYFQDNRNSVYLSYAVYMLSVMLYMLLKLAHNGVFFFAIPNFPLLRTALNEFLQFAIMVTYILFAIKFLKINKTAPRLFKTMKWINIVYLTYGTFMALYFLVSKDLLTVKMMFGPSRVVFFVLSIIIIIWTGTVIKGPLVKYLVWGSSFFLLGNLLAILFTLQMHGVFTVFPETSLVPINFTQMGTIVEILFFSLGIGKSIQLNNLEKEKIQNAYISQLVQNEELNKKHNRELEEKVTARTEEVMAKKKELEDIRAKRKETEFNSKLMDSEMRLLRLQMNPHFIFNSLNSIRYFILKQDEENAIEYIESFSKLLRMILDHSQRKFITLKEELTALEIFLKFEMARFNNKFEYTINIDENILADSIAIQPLLLQPFVENSIWHGLMHKDGKGQISISVKKLNFYELNIIIEDDGVGRKKAGEIKAKNGKAQKSHGTKITKNRIDVLNETMQGTSGFIIDDLTTHNGKPLGTRVTLTLNIQKYEGTNY